MRPYWESQLRKHRRRIRNDILRKRVPQTLNPSELSGVCGFDILFMKNTVDRESHQGLSLSFGQRTHKFLWLRITKLFFNGFIRLLCAESIYSRSKALKRFFKNDSYNMSLKEVVINDKKKWQAIMEQIYEDIELSK